MVDDVPYIRGISHPHHVFAARGHRTSCVRFGSLANICMNDVPLVRVWCLTSGADVSGNALLIHTNALLDVEFSTLLLPIAIRFPVARLPGQFCAPGCPCIPSMARYTARKRTAGAAGARAASAEFAMTSGVLAPEARR